MTSSAAGPQLAAGAHRPRRRWWRVVLLVPLLVMIFAAVDGLLIYNRLERLPFRPPPNRPGTTYLLVGSDSRAFIQSDADRARFGDVRGARADVVLVLHVPDAGEPTLLAVPRDLLVFSDEGIPRRLNVTMLGGGPQGTADAMCRSLGIAVDHVATIGFDGFQSLVDSVGGVDVTVDQPVRDAFTGLQLDVAGTTRLDGAQALAYVRSRHPEYRSGETWAPPADGAATRPDRAGGVMRSVGVRLRSQLRNPLRAQRAAWSAAAAVRVDDAMTPPELIAFARAFASVERYPERSVVLPATTSATPVPIAELAAGAADVLARVEVQRIAFAPNRCTPTLLTARRASAQMPSLAQGDGQ